ncbi:MAG: hypothetical protein JXR97_10190, partial [Planctomycetes bacterium]|nr:hypothetical protein [Planctomycetota bacterium]
LDLSEQDKADKYRRALLWGARSLMQAQMTDDVDFIFTPSPVRAKGGFRTSPEDSKILLGNMSESVSAMILVNNLLKDTDYATTADLAAE